jgi:hypothetical protein
MHGIVSSISQSAIIQGDILEISVIHIFAGPHPHTGGSDRTAKMMKEAHQWQSRQLTSTKSVQKTVEET